MRHVFARRLACSVFIVIALSGCAPKPRMQPPDWRVFAQADHIPMQGLSAARLGVSRAALKLVNFTAAEREVAAEHAQAVGAIGGVLEPDAFRPCLFFPPLCFVAAAIGAAQHTPQPVTPEQDARMTELFKERATSRELVARVAKRTPRPTKNQDFPRLGIELSAIYMLNTKDGVTFILAARAQGFPSANVRWKPTTHFVRLPMRTVEAWLFDDGVSLRTDVLRALDHLGASIASTYSP